MHLEAQGLGDLELFDEREVEAEATEPAPLGSGVKPITAERVSAAGVF